MSRGLDGHGPTHVQQQQRGYSFSFNPYIPMVTYVFGKKIHFGQPSSDTLHTRPAATTRIPIQSILNFIDTLLTRSPTTRIQVLTMSANPFSSPMFSNEWIKILKMVIFHVLMWVLSMTPMRTNSPLCLSMHTKIRYLTMICALNLAQIRCQMPWSRYLLWSNPTITTKKISHHWRWCDNFSHFIWGCFSTLWQIHCPPLD